MTGWAVYAEGGIEIVPQDDAGQHFFGPECPCRPFERDGMLIHRAWDRREFFEPDAVRQPDDA